MAEKNHLTLSKAKQVIGDYLILSSISLNKPLWIDFSKHSSKEIIEFAESLPQAFINYSNTLDNIVEQMEKEIKKQAFDKENF